MTQPKKITDERRRALLETLRAIPVDADDALTLEPRWFLPLDSHRQALRLETLVVRGHRGAGKTSLFRFLKYLQDKPELRSAVREHWGTDIPDARWVDGFSVTGTDHPAAEVVAELASRPDPERRAFWLGWLCRRLSATLEVQLPPGKLAAAATNDATSIAASTSAELSALMGWLDALEQRQQHQPVVVTYDGLDRVGDLRQPSLPMVGSLLAVTLNLADRYRRIRLKAFLREDLFERSSAFPDASKLTGRSSVLEWRTEDLYRALVKRMANESAELREWVTGSTRGIKLREAGALGWMPPPLPEEGSPSQKGFATHLVGEFMGAGPTKGASHRWIPNRVQDAHGRVVPRSFLALIVNAAGWALDHGPAGVNLRLFAPTELQGALAATSLRRVDELREEFQVVGRLDNLRHQEVLLSRRDAVRLLSAAPPEDDGFGEEGERVLTKLIELGVMAVRQDGRVDVPDIYRYGFDIKRKGGVARSR